MLIGTLGGRVARHPVRIALLAVLSLTFIAAPAAHATLRIENHTDPAGDPTVMTYRLSSATWTSGDFTLDAVAWYRSFGQPPGTYTAQAELPAGWQVADIKCLGAGRLGEFAIDVANGRVTMNHQKGDEQTCAFTNRRASASGPPPTGVSPSLPPAQLAKVALPRSPALLRVRTGLRFAAATVRLPRHAVIRGQLLWHGTIVGSARVVHKPGTYVLEVPVSRRSARSLRARGLKRVTLTLRIVVVADNNATHVYRLRALVRL